MKVILEPHTLIRAQERGASETEILEVLNTGSEEKGEINRLKKSIIFDFKSYRLGKYYEQKKIDVIFVKEQENIITITVYVFYGKWN